MKFLAGAPLTKAIRNLFAPRDEVKAAVAYWGSGAFGMLGLSSRRRNVKVICCLSDGRSDPGVIGKFKGRARQNDKLHAKVIWTPNAAIVGSANVSSNGLPEDDGKATGLLEAGFLVEEHNALKEIESWFNSEFRKARRIANSDLEDARIARDKRVLRALSARGSKTRTSFVEALREGSREFVNQPIHFFLFDEYMSGTREKEADNWVKNNQGKIRKRLLMPAVQPSWLDPFEESGKLPNDAYLISIFHSATKTDVEFPVKTFPIKIGWGKIEYALMGSRRVRFPYDFASADQRLIRRAAKDLWRASHSNGKRDGVVPLRRAIPILLKYTTGSDR